MSNDNQYTPPEIYNPPGEDGVQPNGIVNSVAAPVAFIVWDVAGVWNYVAAVNVGILAGVVYKQVSIVKD